MRKLLPLMLCMGIVAAKAQVAALPPAPTGIQPPRAVSFTRQILIQEAATPATPRPLTPLYRATDFQGKPLLPVVPANQATANFGFFCKQELKMDRALPIITRFRLGSQQQADELDGKR